MGSGGEEVVEGGGEKPRVEGDGLLQSHLGITVDSFLSG